MAGTVGYGSPTQLIHTGLTACPAPLGRYVPIGKPRWGRRQMTQAIYSKLIDEICERSKATPSSERYERCDLAVDGTLFTLMPAPDNRTGEINAVAYFGDVGPLPEANPGAAAVELLESNLFAVGRDAPCFCCNPETGHVLIAGRMPLDLVTADSALELLSGLAHLAFEWRESHRGSVKDSQPGSSTASRMKVSAIGAAPQPRP